MDTPAGPIPALCPRSNKPECWGEDCPKWRPGPGAGRCNHPDAGKPGAGQRGWPQSWWEKAWDRWCDYRDSRDDGGG
jgi:hypothetical protein